MNKPDAPLTDHDYDGIQELDNPLPGWWLITFFGTIIFGFLYWIHYSFGGAQTQMQEVKADMAVIEAMQKKAEDQGGDALQAAGPGGDNALGKQVYDSKCAVCHGPELQGSIGPNLTDAYWLHGAGQPEDVLTVIRKGVTDKGMPAWDNQLNKEEMRQVALFVVSKIGTTPANPKPPQGNKVGN